MTFIPAQNKLEAVSRIGRISGGPEESLGPGSKERKTVLTNLYHHLGIDLPSKKTKQQLAKGLVVQFGESWDSKCESAGQTLTLIGLNKILKIAEEKSVRINQKQNSKEFTLDQEVSALESIILSNLPPIFDGKTCVTQMRDAEDRNWRQTEWQGWYFEYLALPKLIQILGGGKKRIGSVTFDYKLQRTWDLKTHSARLLTHSTRVKNDVPMNDLAAMKSVIINEGLGFIILSGDAYPDSDFSLWHKSLRGSGGQPKRRLKAKFIPTSLDFFWLQGESDLEFALLDKVLKPFNQGKQASGGDRRAKFMLDLNKAKLSHFLVSSNKI